jgi:hypothetical protein
MPTGNHLGRMKRLRAINGGREFDEVPSGQFRERLPAGERATNGGWYAPLRELADIEKEVGELVDVVGPRP